MKDRKREGRSDRASYEGRESVYYEEVIFDANVGLPAERCTAVGAVGELMGRKGILLCVR